MFTIVQRKWLEVKDGEDLVICGHQVHHPVLVAGNLTGAIIGGLAIWSAIYALITYGLSVALIVSVLYASACTLIDLLSAYHLATGK